MEFIEKKAKELFVSSSGLSKSGDQFGYGYPFLSYSEIFNNYYIPDKLLTLVNSTEKDRKKCSIQRGDVFLTRTSETTDELGMSCVALKDYPNATFNGFAKRLRPTTNEIVPEYSVYYFRSSYFRAQCMSMATLITRASLNDKMIERLRIRYPKDKDNQSKIANILMSYDKLIIANNKRIETLEQMAENLYKEWFVRFRFPGHETAEFENGIPKRWVIQKLKGIIKRLPFGVLYKAENTEKEGKTIVIDQSQDEYVGFHNNKPSHIASIDSPVALFGDHSCKYQLMITPFSLSENVIPYIGTDDVLTTYLFYLTKGIIETTEYKRHWTEFTSKKVIVAPIDLQIIFVQCVNSFLSETHMLQEQNRNLIKQRDLLLPRLMSGKLEV